MEDMEPLWAALPEWHGWILKYLVGTMMLSIVLRGPVPQEEVQRSPLAPHRRKQESL